MILLNSDTYEARKNNETGTGIFSKAEILQGTIIADYIGKIITNEEADEFPSLHCIVRNENEVIQPNLANIGAHSFNHSCEANCTFYPFNGHIVLVSKRRIFPEEEITTEYHVEGGYFTDPADPHLCKCRSKLCRGTLSSPIEYAKQHEAIFDKEPMISLLNQKIAEYGQEMKLFDDVKIYKQRVEITSNLNIFGSRQVKPLESSISSKDIKSEIIKDIIKETGCRVLVEDLGIIIVGVLYNGYLVVEKI